MIDRCKILTRRDRSVGRWPVLTLTGRQTLQEYIRAWCRKKRNRVTSLPSFIDHPVRRRTISIVGPDIKYRSSEAARNQVPKLRTIFPKLFPEYSRNNNFRSCEATVNASVLVATCRVLEVAVNAPFYILGPQCNLQGDCDLFVTEVRPAPLPAPSPLPFQLQSFLRAFPPRASRIRHVRVGPRPAPAGERARYSRH